MDLLTATGSIDAGLAARALDCLLSNPGTYGIDALLVPAVLRLVEPPQSRSLPVVERLRRHILEHLHKRIAQNLEPPTDWRRDNAVTCSCTYCTDLRRFLADPARQEWRLKAAEAKRRHVEDSVRRDDCQVDCRTDKRGRPYTLVCTKHQARYLRRVEQREQDLSYSARLEKAGEETGQ
jgi:hypothetical protein